MKKLFIFDLDDTLSRSKCPLGDDMAVVLCRLLKHAHIAVVSGASFDQFKKQFIDKIHCEDLMTKLHILPTNGASFYNFNPETGLWHSLYKKLIPEKDVRKIMIAIREAMRLSQVKIPEKIYGKQIENRGSQITVSLLGQEAPISEKKAFDPDQKKRFMIREKLQKMIPGYNIAIGGATSIDITPLGIDKHFAILELLKRLSLTKSEAVYVGDAIFPGGNDYPALEAGIDVIKVKDPNDTKEKLNAILENNK